MPKSIGEIRLKLIQFLNRVHFETSAELNFCEIETPTIVQDFGIVYTCRRQVNTLEFRNLCNIFADEIGRDILEHDCNKYWIYFYQVPSPDNILLLRYVKQIQYNIHSQR